jgi:hypothetical protein
MIYYNLKMSDTLKIQGQTGVFKCNGQYLFIMSVVGVVIRLTNMMLSADKLLLQCMLFRVYCMFPVISYGHCILQKQIINSY